MAAITELQLSKVNGQIKLSIEVEYGADEPSRAFGIAASFVSATNRIQLPFTAIQRSPDQIVVPSDSLFFDLYMDENVVKAAVGDEFGVEALLVELMQEYKQESVSLV